MIKKYILSFCLLCCVIFGFCGCTTVSAMSISYVDGSMSVSTIIVLDKDQLAEKNLSYDDAVGFLDECAYDYWRVLESYFDTDYAEFKANVVGATADYQISINFADADMFKRFTKQDSTSEGQNEQKSSVVKQFLISKNVLLDTSQGGASLLDTLIRLLDKNYMSTDNIVLEKSTKEVYIERFCSIFNKTVEEANQLLSQLNFKLIYAFSTDARIRSNANSQATLIAHVGANKEERTTYRAHIYDYTFLSDLPEIILYRNCLVKENVIEWYVLALILSAVFGLILWLVLFLRARKQNSPVHIKENSKISNSTNDPSQNLT